MTSKQRKLMSILAFVLATLAVTCVLIAAGLHEQTALQSSSR